MSDDHATTPEVLSPDAVLDGTQEEVFGDDDTSSESVEQPAKVMRIGTMVKQLLEEVRAAPLDEAGRLR